MAKGEERRNSVPEDVRVLSNADLAYLSSLDAKADALVENRNEIVIHNIEYILKKNNIAQAHMCNVDLEGSPQPPQMAVYKKVGKDIPLRTVARIGLAYGYTPEQLYGQLLDRSDEKTQADTNAESRPYDEYVKYIGTYQMAYYTTDAKLGANNRSTPKSMSYGVLSVYPEGTVNGVPKLLAAAFINCTDEERYKLVEILKEAEEKGGSVRSCYENAAYVRETGSGVQQRIKCFYKGELTLTDHIAEFTLKQVKGSDTVNMKFHNRAAASSEGSIYRGGLGVLSSTCRGEEKMPCGQSVGLSRRGFDHVAKEELAAYLLMDLPKVEFRDEIGSIIAYMKALFMPEDSNTPLALLSDGDKAFVLESYVEKKLTEVIKRNVLAYHKISASMDSAFYKAVCR